jgi:hypothetical protein
LTLERATELVEACGGSASGCCVIESPMFK